MSQPSFFNIQINLTYQIDGSGNRTLVEGATLAPLAHMSSLRRGVDGQVTEARRGTPIELTPRHVVHVCQPYTEL